MALTIQDRVRSFRFFQEVLDLEPVGEPADDGVPEPLVLAVNDAVHVMLIPPGGFGYVIGARPVAEPGVTECILTLPVSTAAEVDAVLERARAAGAEVVAEPSRFPWGHQGTFADLDGHVWAVASA
ncbi:glyoxalase [Knoellia flava TL1]|uniref:Glyoxalase n=1 Tax=Knoellia flava TL1 TaxID=1385518 RepID=A0ABR4XE62_9MICO|nr:glyoxalase [Knoellia flava TL1]